MVTPADSRAVNTLIEHESAYPLIVVAGPTGSGKSQLALTLAEQMGGEVLSCDSVAVYRGLEIGSAKPSPADRARIPHHGIDLLAPDGACTAGDYARAARAALADIKRRGKLPIVAGGTGLYLRALLEGLSPAPKRDEAMRTQLRARAQKRGSPSLHRLLQRFDPGAAARIHPHDLPKLVRSLEVSLAGRQAQSEQWSAGRDPLRGFNVLRLGLNPPRELLYKRLNARAAAMFSAGLVQETSALLERYGVACRILGSLGYAQARLILSGCISLQQGISDTQQGHRNYAKRQLTWFRREKAIRWIEGFGDDPSTVAEALRYTREHLRGCTTMHPDAPAGVEQSVEARWGRQDAAAA